MPTSRKGRAGAPSDGEGLSDGLIQPRVSANVLACPRASAIESQSSVSLPPGPPDFAGGLRRALDVSRRPHEAPPGRSFGDIQPGSPVGADWLATSALRLFVVEGTWSSDQPKTATSLPSSRRIFH